MKYFFCKMFLIMLQFFVVCVYSESVEYCNHYTAFLSSVQCFSYPIEPGGNTMCETKCSQAFGDAIGLFDFKNESITISLIFLDVYFNNCSIKPNSFCAPNSEMKPILFTSIKNNSNPVLYDNTFEGLCTSLQITMKYNHIQTVQPKAFDCLNQLQVLDLTGNRIESLHPDTFINGANLTYLSLAENSLRELPQNIFARLYSLKTLRLSNNKLQTVSDDTFRNLQNLKNLALSGNRIRVLPPKIFAGLRSLENLHLEENGLRSMSYDDYAELRRQNTTLYMSGNYLPFSVSGGNKSTPHSLLYQGLMLIILVTFLNFKCSLF